MLLLLAQCVNTCRNHWPTWLCKHRQKEKDTSCELLMIPVGAARKETLAHDEENDTPAKKQTRNKPTKQTKQWRWPLYLPTSRRHCHSCLSALFLFLWVAAIRLKRYGDQFVSSDVTSAPPLSENGADANQIFVMVLIFLSSLSWTWGQETHMH